MLSSSEWHSLSALLSDYHEVFSLDDNERGETDLVHLTIDTEEAPLHSKTACKVYTVCSLSRSSPSARNHTEFWNHTTIGKSLGQSH